MKRMLIYCGGAIVLIPLILWLSLYVVHYLPHVSTILAQNKIFFTLFRWIIIVLFFILWPMFIQAQSIRRGWSASRIHYLLSQRLILTAWLVVFEVFICENLPLTIMHYL